MKETILILLTVALVFALSGVHPPLSRADDGRAWNASGLHSYYEEHESLAWGFGAGLASVIVLIAALLCAILKRKRAEQELKGRRDRLEELVSDRTRALEKSEKLLRTVINVTRDAMISIGEDGRIRLFNPAAERMFGRKKEEMTGRRLDCLMPEGHRNGHRRDIRSYFETGLPNRAIGNIVELPGVRRGGEMFPMNVSLSEGESDRERFVIAVARDITDRKKAEESLRLEMMQREQAEEQLKVLVRDLERTNQELRDFAHVASHDLKAPLRGVISLANWLREDYEEALDETGREYIRKLIARTRRMNSLIDGILRYSRAGRAALRPEPVRIRDLIGEIVDSLEPPESIPVVVRDPMPIIYHDRMQLRRVFQNLIANAVEHLGRSEGRVTVSCADRGDAWEFCVRDDGVGIEERHFNKIFQIFQSLDPDSESTGVGLSLIKKIAERNGGSVRVESTVGEGSAFYFTTPKSAAPAEPGRKIRTVLIIDDSKGFSDVAETMLRREGLEVLCALDGAEARRLLESREGPVDLALMDIYIPEENPIERYDMLKRLRPGMRIIVCTGGGFTETVAHLKEKGADGVLIKPFKHEELMEVLK